jgi:hypothetical protein
MEFLRKGETMTMMQLHANYVSASMAGDYYSATFEEEDPGQLETPYLIIQRQFEDPRDNGCYIETHNPEYCGHFRVRRIEFTVERLLVELDRPRDTRGYRGKALNQNIRRSPVRFGHSPTARSHT